MNILWFPRLQTDIDSLHIVTWRSMTEELILAGHKVRLVTQGLAEGFPPGVIVPLAHWRFPGGRLASLRLFAPGLLRRLAREFQPDVIIFDPFTCWLSGLWSPEQDDRPLLLTDHRTPSDHPSQGVMASIKTLFRRYIDDQAWQRVKDDLDGATVITQYYRQLICARHDIKPERIGIWGSGVGPPFHEMSINPQPRPETMQGQVVLIQHGEWSFNRGLLETLDALALCRRQDIHFLLLGKGPAESALRSRIRHLGLSTRVTLHPPVPHSDIPAWLDMADAAIMAYPAGDYWNCNNPIKLMEFLARGKPVILTDMPGFREVADSLPGIVWLEQPSPVSIAEAIDTLANGIDAWQGKGLRSRELILHTHSWASQADQLLRFIEARRADRRTIPP